MAKKDFSKAVTNAADKFFTIPAQKNEDEISKQTDSTEHTESNNHTEHTQSTDNTDSKDITNDNNNTNDDKEVKENNNMNDTKQENNENITKDTEDVQQTDKTHNKNVKNKSKHYDERGKREERYGLLLDKQLKEDLKSLANAYGSRSINDFIITILLEYVETPENQKVLEAYSQLQNLKMNKK